MAIQHSTIADADRHEPKGASTATLNQVIKSKGDGTTMFGSVAWTEISGKPSALASVAILSGASTTASQNPSAANTNTGVVFGTGSTATDATLSSAGVLTFNTGGTYLVQADLNFGRDTGSTPSILYVRVLKNGVAYGSPVEVRLSQAVDRKLFNYAQLIGASASDTITFQFVTDSSGDSGGGLRQDTPTASGWAVVPCAKLTVSKFINLS